MYVCVSVLSITGHTKRRPPTESLQAWCDLACVSPCGYVLLSVCASTCTFVKVCVLKGVCMCGQVSTLV